MFGGIGPGGGPDWLTMFTCGVFDASALPVIAPKATTATSAPITYLAQAARDLAVPLNGILKPSSIDGPR